MLQLLIAFSSLPLPVLLLTIVGYFFLLLAMIILVACIPSAGERLARFLALLKDIHYSKSIIDSIQSNKPSTKRRR